MNRGLTALLLLCRLLDWDWVSGAEAATCCSRICCVVREVRRDRLRWGGGLSEKGGAGGLRGISSGLVWEDSFC